MAKKLKKIKTLVFITGILLLPITIIYIILSQVSDKAVVQIGQKTIISPQYEAHVVKIFAEEGKPIEKGQILMQLSSPELSKQLMLISLSESELLLNYTSTLRNLRQQLGKTSKILTIQSRTLDQYHLYRKSGAVSLVQLNDVITAYNSINLSYQNINNQINLLQSDYQKSLHELSDKRILIEVKINNQTIASPDRGILNMVFFSEGQYVPPNSPLMKVDSEPRIIASTGGTLPSEVLLRSGIHFYRCKTVSVTNNDKIFPLISFGSHKSNYLLFCPKLLKEVNVDDNQEFYIFGW